MTDAIISKVDSLKLLLVQRATGVSIDEKTFRDLRHELIKHPLVNQRLPQFVKNCRSIDEFWSFIKSKFSGTGSYEQRREYLRNEFSPLLTMLESFTRTPGDAGITATVKAVGSGYIEEMWHKALERRSTDPEGAITAARTLLEAVCKHILDAASTTYDDTVDLPKLYSLTAKRLSLSPSQHTEQLFKQILGGCQTVVEGLGALRNRHSDAHGKGATGTRPSPRHAELAVNLSGTMAKFMLQTWEIKQ